MVCTRVLSVTLPLPLLLPTAAPSFGYCLVGCQSQALVPPFHRAREPGLANQFFFETISFNTERGVLFSRALGCQVARRATSRREGRLNSGVENEGSTHGKGGWVQRVGRTQQHHLNSWVSSCLRPDVPPFQAMQVRAFALLQNPVRAGLLALTTLKVRRSLHRGGGI